MNSFIDQFGYEPDFRVFAPARVNLIGEHIDYCGGDVLPMAIQQGTTIWGSAKNATETPSQLRLYSARVDEMLTIDLPLNSKPTSNWECYVQGVLSLLISEEYVDPSLLQSDYFISQNIGSAGLSSSASFCAALAMAFGQFEDLDINERTKIAQLCQRVEHEFAGVNCGIMDQMSVLMGHVIRLDCQSLAFEQVETMFSDVAIVIMDTGAERTLAGSGYNQRIEELGEIAAAKGLDDIRSLARLDIDASGLSDLLTRRLNHVCSEHQRVGKSYQSLKSGQWQAFGALMDQSHESLKNDYEVSCEPLDVMVSLAQSHPGVLGARMTGGGFGGCAVSLVEVDAVDDMMSWVAREYAASQKLTPNLFVAESCAGANFSRL